MLNDADISHFHHVYVFVGKTDLRKGIDGLSTLVKQKFHLDPFHAGDLFLFCGSSNRKIKGLVWEEDGFLLIYKRLEAGTFHWLSLSVLLTVHTNLLQRLKPVTLLRNSIICS